MVQIGAIVTGALLGYLLGQDGRPTPIMVVSPPGPNGRFTTPDELGLTSFGPAQGISGSPSPSQRGLISPIAETLHRNMQPRTNSGTEYLEKMVDARLARVLTIICDSTCDQALSVQLVGHVTDSPTEVNGLINIGGAENLPASNGRLAITVVIEEVYLPYMGVTVTAGAAAPTAGRVVVQAFGQRWASGVEEVR